MANQPDWSEQIQKYSDELRRFREKSELPPSPPAPAAEPRPAPPETVQVPSPTEKTPLESPLSVPTEPTPPFGNSETGTAQTAESAALATQGETDVGTLVVRLQSARGTIPIIGATVTVYRAEAQGDRLIYMGETDENGESPEWPLPTLDRNLSLEPGVAVPYANYAVQANAVGYAAFLNEGVSIFGGVQTLQRIPMLPLPEPSLAFDTSPLVTRPQNPLSELN